MDIFDILAKEWPVITQAPAIVIPGAVLVFLGGWFGARLWDARLIATLRERLAFANEKATAAKEDNALLTKRIESDASKANLLRSAKSTANAINQISAATSRTAIAEGSWPEFFRKYRAKVGWSG